MKRFSTLFGWTFLVLIAVTVYVMAAPAMAADHIPPAAGAPLVLFGFTNIRNLFTRDAIIRYLEQLGVMMPTVVMDTIFPDRPQQGGPLIGEDIIKQAVHAMPLSRRGGSSVSIGGATGISNFYEPFPIKPSIAVNGVDLNNLRVLQGNSANLDAWARAKTDVLRKQVRLTAEAMCADALDGVIDYPVALDGGGWDHFYIKYGDILTVTDHTLWDAGTCKLADVFELLTEQQLQMNQKGVGAKTVSWAGKTAYNALFKLAEKSTTTAKIRVEITDQGINIGGFLIMRRAEQYRNPQTKAFVPVVPDKTLKMIALDAGHVMPYAALDDLDSNLQAMPLFIKPVKDNDGNLSLKGESKPLPVVNPDGICDAVVVA
ncbi:MAG: hypothetical protein A2076_13155 [Geobacteraceae bacterium GWC2_53_11]|nr:MAG: hypothetical protein A2076_13155 [Geobacteraceae bacterium GWC2_53_11]